MQNYHNIDADRCNISFQDENNLASIVRWQVGVDEMHFACCITAVPESRQEINTHIPLGQNRRSKQYHVFSP